VKFRNIKKKQNKTKGKKLKTATIVQNVKQKVLSSQNKHNLTKIILKQKHYFSVRNSCKAKKIKKDKSN